MSLLGEALYQGKKSPVAGLTKLKLGVQSNDGTSAGLEILSYTGAKIVTVTAQNTIVIDLPTTFNNLYQVTTNPQAQSGNAAMLMYAIANLLIFPPNLATNLGKVTWFSQLGVVLDPPEPQWTRVWFTCVRDDGTTFLPNTGVIVCELGIANTSVRAVAPLPP